MNQSLITIALSVYNVETYLRKSLDCIITQTYRNVEILCIDDCSKDGTYAILKNYADKDDRIKVYKQQLNYGLAVSRNRAIEMAQGEYITFLDGDDLFAPDMIEKAYNKAKETDADLVMWDYCTFYEEKDLPQMLKQSSSLIGFEPKDKVALLKRPAFTWVKLIKTSKVRELGIHFPEGLTKQDIPVWWHLVTSVVRISILPENLSYYRQNPQNTSSRKDKSVFSLAYVMDITGKYLKENNLYDTYKNEYLRSRLNLLRGMYDFIKLEHRAEAMQIIHERLDEDAKNYIYSDECEVSDRTKMFFKGFCFGSPIEKFKYNTLLSIRSIYRWMRK